jgi:hypothetical protein
MSVHETPSPV